MYEIIASVEQYSLVMYGRYYEVCQCHGYISGNLIALFLHLSIEIQFQDFQSNKYSSVSIPLKPLKKYQSQNYSRQCRHGESTHPGTCRALEWSTHRTYLAQVTITCQAFFLTFDLGSFHFISGTQAAGHPWHPTETTAHWETKINFDTWALTACLSLERCPFDRVPL